MDFPDTVSLAGVVSRAGVGHDVLLHGLPRHGESDMMYCYMDFPDVVSRAGVGHDVLLHGLPRHGESGWGEARCTVTWTSQTW